MTDLSTKILWRLFRSEMSNIYLLYIGKKQNVCVNETKLKYYLGYNFCFRRMSKIKMETKMEQDRKGKKEELNSLGTLWGRRQVCSVNMVTTWLIQKELIVFTKGFY